MKEKKADVSARRQSRGLTGSGKNQIMQVVSLQANQEALTVSHSKRGSDVTTKKPIQYWYVVLPG